jgi:hypothetical protein
VKILFPWVRSILLGLATLLVTAYAVEGPVLYWSAPLFGFRWIATVHLGLDCAALAAAGFITGRFNRPHSVLAAALFALTLCFWDFGGLLALNVPLPLRLVWDSLQDSRYFDALLTSVETHVLLFGCLFAGAMLSRPREKPVSIIE